jgi:hypothetical protein
MSPWQLICSEDGTLLAEIDGKYQRGSVAPASAYTVIDGVVRYDMPGNAGKPELVCPHADHVGGRRPVLRRKAVAA